jgi:hypothetical protein
MAGGGGGSVGLEGFSRLQHAKLKSVCRRLGPRDNE